MNFGESVGDFLAVCADILNGGGGGKSWDFTESFDAGEVEIAGIFDNVIPIFATHNIQYGTASGGGGSDAAHAIDEDGTRKTFVVTNGIGAVAHNECRKIIEASKIVGFRNIVWGFDFDDVFCFATKTHGREAGN